MIRFAIFVAPTTARPMTGPWRARMAKDNPDENRGAHAPVTRCIDDPPCGSSRALTRVLLLRPFVRDVVSHF